MSSANIGSIDKTLPFDLVKNLVYLVILWASGESPYVIVHQPLVLIADTDHGVGKPPRPGDPETGGRNAGFCGPKLPVVLQRLRRSGAGAPASPPRPPSPLRRQRQEEEDPGDPSADPQSFFDAIIKQSFFSKGRSPRSTPLGMKREPKQPIMSRVVIPRSR